MTIPVPRDPTRRPLDALAGQPRLVEVRHYWQDNLMDVRHHAPGGPPVTVGSDMGWQWSLFGRPVGLVPAGAARVLPLVPPLLSQVRSVPTADVVVSDEQLPDAEAWELVRWEAGAFVLHVPPGWRAARQRGEGVAEAVDATEVELEPGAQWLLDTGVSVVLLRRVPEAERIVAPLVRPDSEIVASGALMAGLAALLVAFVAASPVRPSTGAVEIADRFVDLLLETPEESEVAVTEPDVPKADGKRAPREEGNRGEPEAEVKVASGDPVLRKHEVDTQIAENAGVVGMLSDAGAFEGIFGSSGLSSDLTGAIGGLIGAKGTQIGTGLGSRGMGFGGGGDADHGAIGLATQGAGTGYGEDGGGLGPRVQGAIPSMGEGAVFIGALDRAAIDEVIRRHLKAIRYCYQRQLQVEPELSGKVTMRFTIAQDGSVSSVKPKSSTLGSAAVHACLEDRFFRMQFPEPRGGGIVIVSYPFLFANQ